MRVLLTGGAGTLGSNILDHWKKKYDSAVVIDNFETGKREYLSNHSGIEIIEGSIADKSALRVAFEASKPDLIVHCAASYNNPNDWTKDLSVNAQGAINLVELAKEFSVSQVINFQTALCYGNPVEIPIPVTHPIQPITSYGISKSAGEMILLNSGLNVISLRLANVTGPRLLIGPIPTFYKNLKQNMPCTVSTTIRDFLDNDDFLSLMDTILNNPYTAGIYNVSTGSGHTIQEIFETVSEYLGMPESKPEKILTPGPDDISSVILDPEHTETTFGWKAKTGFKETIFRTLKWYDENGVNEIHSHLQKRA